MTWATTRFATGRGIGLIGPATVALVLTDDAAVRDTLWSMVAVDAPVDELLEALTGHGLRALPSFAIARIEDERVVRVVVRGEVSAGLVADGGRTDITAGTARTWVEREVTDVDAVELWSDDPPSQLPFHVLAGAVPCGSLQRSLTVADPTAELDAMPAWPAPDPDPGPGPDPVDTGATLLPADLDRMTWSTSGSSSTSTAAPAPPPAPPAVDVEVSSAAALGDHDGKTISRAELARLRADHATVPAGPVVLARRCVAGHPNPPQLTVCRTCGAAVSTGPVVNVPRPVLGVLRFSNGVVVQLDRPQLIGRSPKVEGHVGGELPNLVRLDDVGQGVSRRHLAVHIDNWQVLLEDLNSSNGTIVTLPGRPARRLVAGERVAIDSGTIVDLGGELSMGFEVTR